MQHMRWESFSTETVRPSQRLSLWNDYGSETLGDLTVDPCDRDCFNATLSRIEFGPLGLIEMKSTGASASGGLGVGGWAAAEKDALLLILAETGHSDFTESHRKLNLSPGDLLIRDLSKSWTHTCRAEINMLMVKMPYSALLSRIDDPARLQGANLPAHQPAVAFTVEVIRAINRTLKTGTCSDLNGSLADVMLDSLGMIYRSVGHTRGACLEQRHRIAIRRDAKTYIMRHLDDPELSVAMVSTALGVSPRKLQRAFIEAGEAPSQFILSQRLDRAAIKLLQPRGAQGSSVLDIALSVGFNDASHFSRSFARRFGISPRGYRGTPPL